MGKIVMDAKEMKIYRLACEVLAGKYTSKEFAILIGKSQRQAQRIVAKVKKDDFLGVIHGNTQKRPHNKSPERLEALVVDLLKFKYEGFNLTHFREMLIQNENLNLSTSFIYRVARKNNLIKSPKRRVRRSYRPRERMPQEGMLIQFDGSDHVWFGDHRSDLIAAIDDATGEIKAAEFFYGEKSIHSLKVIKEVVDNNGVPEAFYMDQAGIYGKLDKDFDSQISRAFNQVNIRLILASSPQAKGRVERLFRTLQDRLVAELKFYNVITIEEANHFLKKKFIPKFNMQFSVKATESEKAYRKNVFGNLDLIFCKKERRKVGVGNIFQWNSVTWVVDSKRCYRGREVNINTHVDGSQSFDIMGKKINATIIDTRRKYSHKKRAV
jgi:hypothetical protein